MGWYGRQWEAIVNVWDFRVFWRSGQSRRGTSGTKQDQLPGDIISSQDIAAERCSFSVLVWEGVTQDLVEKSARRPISRVLSGPWRAVDDHSSGTSVAGRLARPTRMAPAKTPFAAPVSRPAGHPYAVLLPVGFALPPPLPAARCALTAPFHPCRLWLSPKAGGLLSVALSLGSPPPGVTRHRVSVEPGLSSSLPSPAGPRSSGRLARGQVERRAGRVNGPRTVALADCPRWLAGAGRPGCILSARHGRR